MGKPLIVSIPHRLGKTHARERLKVGFSRLKAQFQGKLVVLDDTWDGDRMSFETRIIGQAISGHLEVLDDHVLIEVMLPWIFAMGADAVRNLIQKQGRLLLTKG